MPGSSCEACQPATDKELLFQKIRISPARKVQKGFPFRKPYFKPVIILSLYLIHSENRKEKPGWVYCGALTLDWTKKGVSVHPWSFIAVNRIHGPLPSALCVHLIDVLSTGYTKSCKYVESPISTMSQRFQSAFKIIRKVLTG